MANPARFDQDMATKIAAMIRLLLSDKIGEANAAAQMLPRILRNAGTDVVNKVAELITGPFDGTSGANGQLPEAVMQEVFDAGVKEGIKQVERKLHREAYRDVVQLPPARDMAMYCYQRLDVLNDWERKFITDIAGITRTQSGPLSPKRQAHLEKIYLKLNGKI